MKKTGLSVDFKNGIINVPADIREKASIVNSNEYNALRQAMADNPGFTVKYAPKKKANKVAHKGLTIAFMDNYIDYSDDRDEIVGGYDKVKAIYKGHPAYYAKVKQYFLSLFPELTAEAIKMEQDAEEAAIKLVDELRAKAKAEPGEPTDEADTLDLVS